jgi:HupE / UreJ protein
VNRWCVGLVLLATTALAHKPSDSYLRLAREGDRVRARWDIAVRDLEVLRALDLDGDGTITWAEVDGQHEALEALVRGHLAFSQRRQPCPSSPSTLQAVQHSDGVYAVFRFDAQCASAIEQVEVTDSLLFDLDAQHRGLVRLEGEGDTWTIFTADQRTRELSWATVAPSAQLWLALTQGVQHILSGWDHLAFLLALLLPSVLRRRPSGWAPVDSLTTTLAEVLKVVTSFTVAHSLTLGLAAFGVLAPEPKWVEVAIALSVVAAAGNNLVPLLPEGRWVLAFGLGLMHGFGFVSALADLGGSRLWLSVLGFNLGVEVGQAAIVALFVPMAFWLRRTQFYRVTLTAGSLTILSAALVWTWQRL